MIEEKYNKLNDDDHGEKIKCERKKFLDGFNITEANTNNMWI